MCSMAAGWASDSVEVFGDLCRDMGWHLQFLIDARELPPLATRLSRLGAVRRGSHRTLFPTSAGLDCAGFRTLVSLVRDGGWVKLQGAFRCSVEGPPYHDTIPFAGLSPTLLRSDASGDRAGPMSRTGAPHRKSASFWTWQPTGYPMKSVVNCCSLIIHTSFTDFQPGHSHRALPYFSQLESCGLADR